MTQTTDQDRAEFEAWLGIKPCGAAHDLAWSAWKAARRAPAAPVPQGWKLVPVEPTEKMVLEGSCSQTFEHGHRYIGEHAAKLAWQFMLAGAPQPPENQTTFQTEVGAIPKQPDGLMRENLATKPEAAKEQCQSCRTGSLYACTCTFKTARNSDPSCFKAASVQLPEPVAAESRFTSFSGDRWKWCSIEHAKAFGQEKGYEVRYLYTEQQVRELLAAHGIKVNP